MKRTLLAVAAVAVLVVMTGCAHHARQSIQGSCSNAPETCQSCTPGAAVCHACGGRGCGLCAKHRAMDNAGAFTPGPPAGAVTYPYYTPRGPRDFLARNPQSIGP